MRVRSPTSRSSTSTANWWRRGNNVDPGDYIYVLGGNQFEISGSVLTVELWEDDGIWGDDHLGNFYVYAAYQGAGQQESYVFGNGEYILRYEVI